MSFKKYIPAGLSLISLAVNARLQSTNYWRTSELITLGATFVLLIWMVVDVKVYIKHGDFYLWIGIVILMGALLFVLGEPILKDALQDILGLPTPPIPTPVFTPTPEGTPIPTLTPIPGSGTF